MKKTMLTEGKAVPFVVTRTTLERAPSMKRTSHFVGVRSGLMRLAYGLATKAIEAVEEAFFEKDVEVDDGGVIEQKHYAVFVDTEGGHPRLEVQEMPWKPGCGAHYEIVSVQGEKAPPRRQAQDRDREETEATRKILLERMGIPVPDPAPAPAPEAQEASA